MNSWEDRWNQLVLSYPHLSSIQNESVKILTASKAQYNPVTKLFQLPPHLLSEVTLQELHAKEDDVTEVVGKGHQHGKRTWLVSSVIGATKSLRSRKKKKTKDTEIVREEIDTMQRDRYQVAAATQASLIIHLPEIKLLDTYSSRESIAQHQQQPQHVEGYRPVHFEGYRPAQLNDDILVQPMIQPAHIEHGQFSYPNATKGVRDPNVTKDVKKVAQLLREAEKRPKNIYRFATQLAHVSTQTPTIYVTSPRGMHKEDFTEIIELESMMQLCVNGLVDIRVLNWYTMYLYQFGKLHGFDQTAYFNLQKIELSVCNNNEGLVTNYIKDVMQHHKDKHFFVAPYLAGEHWSLFMIRHDRKDKKCYGFIIDSFKKRKSPSCYVITNLFEQATGEIISWQMVNCYQQGEKWESGYYVMKAMYDFVLTCKENLIMHDSRSLYQREIDAVTKC